MVDGRQRMESSARRRCFHYRCVTCETEQFRWNHRRTPRYQHGINAEI